MTPLIGRVQLDALGLLDIVVRFLLHDLVQVADDEGPRVADAPLVDQANVVQADRGVGRHGDLVDHAHGRAGLALSLLLLLFGVLGIDLDLGLLFHFRLEAGMTEQQSLRLIQVGSGDGHIDGRAGLGAIGADDQESGQRQAPGRRRLTFYRADPKQRSDQGRQEGQARRCERVASHGVTPQG